MLNFLKICQNSTKIFFFFFLVSWNLTDERLLFNNQEILIEGKPFVNREWLRKNICSMRHLLDSYGNFLAFTCFREKYLLTNTNFLQYYQVVSAVTKRLLVKSRTAEVSRAECNWIEPNLSSFLLADKVIVSISQKWRPATFISFW